MNPQHLSEMANNIADFFHAEPDHAVAVDGVANHIAKFWEPRMRRQILAYRDGGATDLHPLVVEALKKIEATAAA
ncbi:MAG: formate dehydrogenase subunit delta [Nevskia sp.]